LKGSIHTKISICFVTGRTVLTSIFKKILVMFLIKERDLLFYIEELRIANRKRVTT
jgi:hypothetical protein